MRTAKESKLQKGEKSKLNQTWTGKNNEMGTWDGDIHKGLVQSKIVYSKLWILKSAIDEDCQAQFICNVYEHTV